MSSSWGEPVETTVGSLKQGDFLERTPSFTTRGPRGGLKRYRPTRVMSGIETTTPDGDWVRLTFVSHRGVRILAPADLTVTARILQ